MKLLIYVSAILLYVVEDVMVAKLVVVDVVVDAVVVAVEVG